MKFAYLDEKRIDINDDIPSGNPVFKCAEGHIVIPRRGTKNAHHFAHKASVECSCGDNKGEWHIWWQERVLPEFLEVRFTDDTGKLHIADICVPGFIHEIQHSDMKVDVMRKREAFYTTQGYTLIWIFDCRDWEYNILKRQKQSDSSEEITFRKKRGKDFPLSGAISTNVLKFFDFGKNSLFQVSKQCGNTITGKTISLEDFDKKYLNSLVREERDCRVFHHPI